MNKFGRQVSYTSNAPNEALLALLCFLLCSFKNSVFLLLLLLKHCITLFLLLFKVVIGSVMFLPQSVCHNFLKKIVTTSMLLSEHLLFIYVYMQVVYRWVDVDYIRDNASLRANHWTVCQGSRNNHLFSSMTKRWIYIPGKENKREL